MRMRLTLILTLLLAPAAALAGPPFMTDDPEPVELEHWELYLATQLEWQGGDVAGSLPQFEVNYGAAPDLQLHAIVPLEFEHTGGDTRANLGDVELGAKYRFLQETDRRPQAGIFPLLVLPTGNSERGQQIFLPVWLQKSFGKWTTYGGGGLWLTPAYETRIWWAFGWQLQRHFSEKLTAGAELFHETRRSPDAQAQTTFNVGAIWNVSDRHHVLASLGRTFADGDVNHVYVGYQLTFGPTEHDVPPPTIDQH